MENLQHTTGVHTPPPRLKNMAHKFVAASIGGSVTTRKQFMALQITPDSKATDIIHLDRESHSENMYGIRANTASAPTKRCNCKT